MGVLKSKNSLKLMNGGYRLSKIFNFHIAGFLCIFALGILTLISGCGEGSGDDNNGGKSLLSPVLLLPDDDEISGWKTMGAYEEANDYDSLYALINGGAQIYIDNGFVSAVFPPA